MNPGEEVNIATDMCVESVDRLHGERAIGLILKHSSGRKIGVALSDEEAAVLFVRLIDALRTDDKAPQSQRTLHFDRKSDAQASLPVAEIQIHVDHEKAILLIETEDKLQIPFTMPHATLAGLGRAIASMRERKDP